MAGIQGTLSLDTRAYEDALRNAQQTTAKWGQQIELQSKNVSAQFKQMVKAFDPEAIIRKANTMAAAVEHIGGASRLTENEQRRVNSVVSEAIAKYQALGQTAPANLLKLRDATQQTHGWMDKLKGSIGVIGPALAGAFAVRQIGQAVSAFTELSSQLTDLSKKTGIGVEGLQKLKFAAEQNGVSLEAVTKGVTMLGDRLVSGDKSAVSALQTLGLSFDQLRTMAPDQMFTEVARAVGQVENPMERAKLAMDLFGRSGQELLPILSQDFVDLTRKAEDLGLVLSEDVVQAGDELGDAWDVLKAQGMALIAQVLKPFIPLVLQLMHAFMKLAQTVGPLVSGLFKGIQQAFLSVAIAIDSFLLRLVEAGQRIPLLGKHLGFLSGAADWLKKDIQGAMEQFARMNGTLKTTETVTTATVAPMRQLGDGTKKAGESAKKAAREFEQLLEAVGRINSDLARSFTGGSPGRELSIEAIIGKNPDLGFLSKLVSGGGLDKLPGKGLTIEQILGPAPKATGQWAGKFAQTILGAFTGGGDISKTIGGFFGGELFGKIGGSVAAGLGGALGSALGSVIPGLGTMLGGFVGDLFGKLFGGEATKTKQMRAAWLEQAGGLAEVRQMAEYAGVSIDKLLSTKKTKTFEAEVRKLEAAFKAVQERVQKTITDLDALGKSGGLMSGALAKAIIKDFDKPEVQDAFKAFVEQNLQGATAGLTRYLQAAKDLPLTAKSAAALGAALAGVYKQTLALGGSSRQALAALKPAIDALVAKLKETGLSGGEAFDQLRRMAEIASDTITGPLLDGIEGLTAAMVGLANAGILTEDMFQGLAEQVRATYDKLIQQGLSAEEALRAIAPALQIIFELQQKYGWAVDEATQALIDQGKEAGLVGDHMKDVMQQVLDVLKAIAKVLGADIPGAAQQAADAIGKIRPPDWQPPPESRPRPPEYQTGSGGVRDFGGGTLAMLHGREAVMTEAQLRNLLTTSRGPSVTITINALDTQSVKTAVEREVIPALIDIYRGNVRGSRTATRDALGVA